MQKLCTKLKTFWKSGLDDVVVVASGALLLLGGSSLAQQLNKTSFSSPDAACRALFGAVKSGDEHAVARVLGDDEQIASSGDPVEDRHDRELFVEKYQQMHRLVKQPDGTTELYIGAENWPFPVPLITRQGKWYFDSNAGKQEVTFRRIGENEAATIEVCREIATNKADVREADRLESTAAQYGYSFQKLGGGRAAAGGFIAVAYPTVYRSSGVMTFVLTRDGRVYEKDLGGQGKLVAVTTWKPDSSWSIVK